MGLGHVSFAYTSRETAMPLDDMRPEPPDPAGSQANNVDVVGFVHPKESILDTSMRLWIQDPRLFHVSFSRVRHQSSPLG